MKKTSFIMTLIVIAVIIISTVSFWNETRSFEAKVYSVNVQQKTSGDKDGFHTNYTYIVGTSKGTLSITPDGLMASSAFGTLEKDSTYHFFTRGYSIPFLGIYPYIMTATPASEWYKLTNKVYLLEE